METKTYRAERECEIVPHSTTQNLKQEELDFMINTNPTKNTGWTPVLQKGKQYWLFLWKLKTNVIFNEQLMFVSTEIEWMLKSKSNGILYQKCRIL